MTESLDRIAAALERMAPLVPVSADPTAHDAYHWAAGRLSKMRHFAPLPLDLLQGIDRQKRALLDTLDRHARGLPAHDVLLWGARGTGKSALAKSAVAATRATGADLVLVEVTDLATMAMLFDTLAGVDRRFVLFLDDLGFASSGDARVLRSLLDGGAEVRPDNARLVVTSNRRHLLPRDIAEQESAINPRDAVDDQLALADRFGLSLGFHLLDQDGYLAIVAAYAARFGLPLDGVEAIGWATRRGSRSGRVAWHYIVDLAGRSGVPLVLDQQPSP